MGLFDSMFDGKSKSEREAEQEAKRKEFEMRRKLEEEERERARLEAERILAEERTMCVAGNEIAGYKIKENKGMVCGVVTYQSPMKGLFLVRPGPNNSYSEQVNIAIEEARRIAFEQAKALGANAITNVDLDFNEFEFHTQLVVELIYLYVTVHYNGNAVIAEKIEE